VPELRETRFTTVIHIDTDKWSAPEFGVGILQQGPCKNSQPHDEQPEYGVRVVFNFLLIILIILALLNLILIGIVIVIVIVIVAVNCYIIL